MMDDATRDHMLQMAIEISNLRAENEHLQNSLNSINEKFVGNIIAIQSRANVEIDKFRAENEKLRAALAAERERCYLAAVGTTCSVDETADYYSGYCDGVQDAATALKETNND